MLDTPLNVRVFLARLICNCKYAFAPYAAYWIRPIMKLVIKGNTFGAPINYLVQDLVVLVIVWGEQVTFKDTYDDRVLISDFVVRQIFAHVCNLDLIQVIALSDEECFQQ